VSTSRHAVLGYLSEVVHLCRVEVTEDTKIPNAATVKVVKQDHTLANMVRGYVHSTLAFATLTGVVYLSFFSQLLSMPQVLFAGYKVPHPLHPYFLVKVQTDGTITPTAAVEQACTKLIGTLSSLEAKFKREFSFKDVEGVTTEDAYGTSTAGPAWTSGRDYMDF
jgi:DNA-directed RNA polymerase II subunit RPB11